MLDGFVRMAIAAALAIAIGLGARQLLMSFMPGNNLPAVLMRAAMLCTLGVAAYVASARLLRLDELVHWREKLLPGLKRKG